MDRKDESQHSVKVETASDRIVSSGRTERHPAVSSPAWLLPAASASSDSPSRGAPVAAPWSDEDGQCATHPQVLVTDAADHG
jgi:hypothetical protein